MALTAPKISSSSPIQFSIPLPHAPQTRIHVHLTILQTSVMAFLTTTGESTTRALSSMGSFVYSLPNRDHPTEQPISTPLYIDAGTVDFASRLAKALARRVGKPVYVGSSVSFSSAGRGGDVEEEMEGFRAAVDAIARVVTTREE
ncbi:hypothetical protein P152DRAFT_459373 [Eremomyces bilateralis CBS 781.70]|uniref:Uncharacterized protein n=1 Tax=Eremomyces bilateralis CBS 781.70 TaxID=1392243 RepID=A0A6G1G0C8_9PEZI|nr:uncharacterized protein P152DRAFT_459373 [Eremomyces bilateralis CBS 781.70]KAF1811432.1 hypothetical protein P152DRAFT_459373 [Eremomyces bilateralis CBS 781.70]